MSSSVDNLGMKLPFAKSSDKTGLRGMIHDLNKNQENIVKIITDDSDGTGRLGLSLVSEMQTRLDKLEAVIRRLERVTAQLAANLEEEEALRVRPWYVRIFCR